MLDPLHDGLQFALDPVAMTAPEGAPDPLTCHAPQSQFAAAFEDLPDGMPAFENEVLTVLNLMHVVAALQFRVPPVLVALRTQQHRPMVQPLLYDFAAQSVEKRLQDKVFHGEQRIVLLAESDALPPPLSRSIYR